MIIFSAFPTKTFLVRHQKMACGKSFVCSECNSVFGAIESLQTHCRRKGHLFSLAEFKSNNIGIAEDVIRNENQELMTSKDLDKKKKTKAEGQLLYPSSNKYAKIAPKPSIHAMTAAIALSELSSTTSVLPATTMLSSKIEIGKMRM